MGHIVYIGIGSNLGDRWGNCVRAIEKIRRSGDIEVTLVSKLRETEALTQNGGKQPAYINGVIKISTDLSPFDLLGKLKRIEGDMGRMQGRVKWFPRVIDLDILFYDDMILNEENLVIPHPEVQKRMFVLEPLCDIAPDLVHPVIQKTIEELCSAY